MLPDGLQSYTNLQHKFVHMGLPPSTLYTLCKNKSNLVEDSFPFKERMPSKSNCVCLQIYSGHWSTLWSQISWFWLGNPVLSHFCSLAFDSAPKSWVKHISHFGNLELNSEHPRNLSLSLSSCEVIPWWNQFNPDVAPCHPFPQSSGHQPATCVPKKELCLEELNIWLPETFPASKTFRGLLSNSHCQISA